MRRRPPVIPPPPLLLLVVLAALTVWFGWRYILEKTLSWLAP
jgi:hypothetical protein